MADGIILVTLSTLAVFFIPKFRRVSLNKESTTNLELHTGASLTNISEEGVRDPPRICPACALRLADGENVT